jgi:hypothetical protein
VSSAAGPSTTLEPAPREVAPLRDGIILPQFGSITIAYVKANDSIFTNRTTTGWRAH